MMHHVIDENCFSQFVIILCYIVSVGNSNYIVLNGTLLNLIESKLKCLEN